MNLGPRKVTKEWPVRLQITVFTIPVGSIVNVRSTHEDKSVVEFSERDIDWFSNSEIEKYTAEMYILRGEV